MFFKAHLFFADCCAAQWPTRRREKLWPVNCTTIGMIERCFFALLSVALIGSLGGFFLYVPILPNLAVIAILSGLGAMFWLGVRVGRRPQDATISHTPASEGNQLSPS
jgi:hypothetical protein